MSATDIVFYIAILIMSVVIHEVSHGFVAEYFGDKTARYAGRLTLNPLKHLDLFGSIILPLLLIVTKAGFIVGWAKPVPYNPDNLSNKKWGTISVALAGILANLAIALVFGAVIQVANYFQFVSDSFFFICGMIVFLNLLLAFFNLMPFPPLDGS
ncbi:MAG: site-2 protease family protein, partial [Patescibacteria group bacterium]